MIKLTLTGDDAEELWVNPSYIQQVWVTLIETDAPWGSTIVLVGEKKRETIAVHETPEEIVALIAASKGT